MPTDKLTIGLIQREIVPGDPAGNLIGTLEILHRLADQEVELMVLSELWATGLIDPADPASIDLASTIDGPTVMALREFCSETGVFLLAGSIAIREKDDLKNMSLLIDPSGEIILSYSKVHLFSPMGEDNCYKAGDELFAVDIKGVGIGVQICYDLRFPGITRSLARSGVELVLVPSLWPEVRINQYETLLRARSIENQVYMAGVNGLLNQNGIFFPGHSLLTGPSGEALNSAEMRESTIVRKIDIAKLRKLRGEICYIDEETEINSVNWLNRVNEPGG